MIVTTSFIEGVAGKLFAIERKHPSPTHIVLILQPFFEEMNKSRSMLSTCARRLASNGALCLCYDHAGTGDSTGVPDLSLWAQDLAAIAHKLNLEHGLPQFWLAVRGAAMVTVKALAQVANKDGSSGNSASIKLIFCNPVFNGKTCFAQLARLRLSADLLSEGDRKTTMHLIRQEVDAGTTEIAGYSLHKKWVEDVESFDLATEDLRTFSSRSVAWFDILTRPADDLTPLTAKGVQLLRDAKSDVHAETVLGNQFWATQEITQAPLFICAIERWIARMLE